MTPSPTYGDYNDSHKWGGGGRIGDFTCSRDKGIIMIVISGGGGGRFTCSRDKGIIMIVISGGGGVLEIYMFTR